MSKLALITGGTGGIGSAVAIELGKAGYKVIVTDIDDNAGEKLVAELTNMNIEVEYYHLDVTNEDEVNKFYQLYEQKYDHLDCLINNAGGLVGRQKIEVMDTSFYRKVLGLNLDSAFFMTRSFLPLLKKGTNPSIINYSSNAGWNAGGPGAGIYATSKGAIITFTRACAKEFAEFGIRVNAVSPGTINTAFHNQIKRDNPALFESWKNNILMKRFGNADEVAKVVEFLVSDKASFITGEIIQINGGQDLL